MPDRKATRERAASLIIMPDVSMPKPTSLANDQHIVRTRVFRTSRDGVQRPGLVRKCLFVRFSKGADMLWVRGS